MKVDVCECLWWGRGLPGVGGWPISSVPSPIQPLPRCPCYSSFPCCFPTPFWQPGACTAPLWVQSAGLGAGSAPRDTVTSVLPSPWVFSLKAWVLPRLPSKSTGGNPSPAFCDCPPGGFSQPWTLPGQGQRLLVSSWGQLWGSRGGRGRVPGGERCPKASTRLPQFPLAPSRGAVAAGAEMGLIPPSAFPGCHSTPRQEGTGVVTGCTAGL